MPCPPEVLALIARFNEQREDYQNPSYLETQLRIEFIDPLLKILGWDVENKQGFAEAYKEVIHEYSLKTKDATKAPDYCFRIGPARKFFLEAKKPAENIKEDKKHAYQLRRYAWSADLPLSILTDFQEWAIYDTNIKPEEKDKASVARVMFFTCDELAEKWDEFAAIFSKQAIQKGSFDKYAASNKKKRGTGRVDTEFLAEIERWRDILAHNIALRNENLSQRDLNFSVQRIIDRIIFLRIAEDRGIEDYGRLQALVNGPAIYPRLMQLFRSADDRYNSGIFHFEKEKGRSENPDSVTPDLAVDDKVLRDILECLYFPKSPYEFSVLPADILGQVYEQFLGKVITLTPGHRAKVDEKPEVKKAGGVYYTPTYIVDYIVKQTVGKLLDKKTPKQVAKLTILDPACGSGSFLIGAYQFLLDWHLQWYVNDGPEKHRKEIYLGARGRESLASTAQPSEKTPAAKDGGPPRAAQPGNGDWRLTSAERKRILLNNIYGVDIDEQAVEVTKLSLLLKVLEGENRESLDRQLRLVEKHRALPDLGNNIKCGNSLIGHDFYAGKQLDMFGEEERLRINTFEWKDEFPTIMKGGGFDAVIGNPPYVRQETLADFKAYFEANYRSFQGTADLFIYFIERALKLLIKNGRLSFIVSSSLLRATYAANLRAWIREAATIARVVDFGGLAVFQNAKDTYVCIPLIINKPSSGDAEAARISTLDFQDLEPEVDASKFSIPLSQLSAEAWSLKSASERRVFSKIKKLGVPLGEYVDRKMFVGIKTGFNEAFEIDASQRERMVRKNARAGDVIKPFLGGQDIRRYRVDFDDRYLITIPCGWTNEQIAGPPGRKPSESFAWAWFRGQYPLVASHLEQFESKCRARQDQGDYWWELRPCVYYSYLDGPKIIFPDICKGPRFFLDSSGLYLSNTAYLLGNSEPYLLGILNSRLFWFAISHISIPFGIRAGKFRYRLIYQYMKHVPIRQASLKSKPRAALESLISQMLALEAKASSAKSDLAKASLERQITATDRQIDQLVYELYELTPEEIKIVEEATA